MERLYLGEDMVAQLAKLLDQDGVAVTSATAQATLYQHDGVTEVPGVVWPITLTHDTGGTYVGDLSRDIQVAQGDIVWLYVVADYHGKRFTEWCEAYVDKRRA